MTEEFHNVKMVTGTVERTAMRQYHGCVSYTSVVSMQSMVPPAKHKL